METNCEYCTKPIDVDEAQLCELCELDGIGNCCISALDHHCEGPEPGTRVHIDAPVPGGTITGMEGDFLGVSGTTAEVQTRMGIVAGGIDTLRLATPESED